MNQVFLSAEEQEEDKKTYPEVFNQRWGTYNGTLKLWTARLMEGCLLSVDFATLLAPQLYADRANHRFRISVSVSTRVDDGCK